MEVRLNNYLQREIARKGFWRAKSRGIARLDSGIQIESRTSSELGRVAELQKCGAPRPPDSRVAVHPKVAPNRPTWDSPECWESRASCCTFLLRRFLT